MSEERGERARRFLDVLEREETKLLAWGVVDGGFNHEELTERAEELIDARGWGCTTNDLLRDLFDRKLLFLLQSPGGPVYRTRMAEAVRLFSRLRQLFPNRRWELAPTLVADFRFDRRDRRYPVRSLKPPEVIASLAEAVSLTPLKRDALSALLRAHGPRPLELAEFQSQRPGTAAPRPRGPNSRGLIIGAGTGTGKTLAFYFPALTHIAGLVERTGSLDEGDRHLPAKRVAEGPVLGDLRRGQATRCLSSEPAPAERSPSARSSARRRETRRA